jgi:hypothetical protein
MLGAVMSRQLTLSASKLSGKVAYLNHDPRLNWAQAFVVII